MSANSSSELKCDIGHVLFIDIVGYPKALINEQSDALRKVKEIVRATEQVRIQGGSYVSYPSPLTPALLRLDAMFDPLRNNLRFQKLCGETKW